MNAPTMTYINSFELNVTYPNGKSEIVPLNNVGDSFGSITCPFPPCNAVGVEIGSKGFAGTYNPP